MQSRVGPSTIDVGLGLYLVRRALRTKSLLAVLALGLSLTGLVAFLSRPVYLAESVLVYEDPGVFSPWAPGDPLSPRKIGLSLQDMLFSPALLEKLIGELGLYPETVERLGMVAAVEEMRKSALGFRYREGFRFHVSFASTSPGLAQSVTARAAELLVQAHVDARLHDAQEAERFFDRERARVGEELRDRESKLALFLAEHPEVAETIATPARAKHSELQRRVRESRDHREWLENRQFQAKMHSLFTTQGKRGGLVLASSADKPEVSARSPRLAILAVGIAISLALAIAVGLMRVNMDDRLRRAVDLRRFDLPELLCEVPPP